MEKRIIAIVFAIMVTGMLFNSSCDKIEEPFKPVYGDLDTSLYPGPGDYQFPEFDATFPSNVENVLIEDYTGHRCGNCPEAADIAHELEEMHAGRVIVATIHASPSDGFQQVSEPGDSEYPKYSHDFRTEAGDAYVEDINGFIGNPMGMVNRKIDNTGSNWKFVPSWSTAVNDIVSSSDPLLMNLQLKLNYYTETRGLFVHAQSKTLQNINGRYQLVLFLLEQDFYSWQKDYTLPSDQQDIEEYHHKDIVRMNINGTYGTMLFDQGSTPDEVFENHFSIMVPEEIQIHGTQPDEEAGISVIGFIMNRDTYEIVQVIKEKVKVNY